MYLKIFLSFILSLWMCISYSQNLKGVVYDAQTKEPVAFATIQINNNQVTQTDAQGNFKLICSEANPVINISAIGFKPQENHVKTNEDNIISLQPVSSQLQEVIVTANREASLRTEAPIAISKISSRVIEETKPVALYEVLNKVLGVLTVNLSNEQHAMAIRQPMTTSNYYLYMEDGLAIRPMGIFNHNALLEINQFAISNIEVVKGPVSSIYGPEAVGGTVNFITQRPTAIPTGRIGLQLDQYGYQRIQFGAGAKVGKFGFYAGGLASKQTNSWMASSDYNKAVFNIRLEYHFNSNLRLIASSMFADYFSETTGNIDSLAFYTRNYNSTSDFTFRKSIASRSRLTLEKDWSLSSHSFVTLFNRYNQLEQNPNYAIKWSPTNNPTIAKGEINNNNFSSYGLLAQHSERFKFLASKLISGLLLDYTPNDYSAYQIDLSASLTANSKAVEKYALLQERPDIKLADYKAKIKNSALYLQYDFKPLKQLTVSTGFRYDKMSFDYDNYLDNSSGNKKYQQLTSKIGLTYDLKNNKGLYTNFSQGFAPPALTAIFRKKPGSNDFYYNLQAAQFQNAELGGWASLLKQKLYIDLAIYQLLGKNELLNIRQADNSFDYQSAGKTSHKGVELGVTVKSSEELIWRFSGTLAIHKFVDFKISDKQNDLIKNLDGFEMPSAPRFIWNTELNYYPKKIKNLRTSLEWQYVSGWYENQINTASYKGYNLLNFRAGYNWKAIEIFGNVLNLTNALYATNATRGNNVTDRTNYATAAPRTFIVGLQYNFTGIK